MRLSVLRSMLFGVAALLALAAFPGCENPLDPLDESDKIEGLSHFDFSISWDLWDSDPAYDGVTVSLTYYNELHETLDFHDKPHNILVEFWSQKNIGEADEEGNIANNYYTKDKLLYSRTIVFENSDDIIRIPIESYYQYIPEPEVDPDDPTTETKTKQNTIYDTCYVVVKIYPPEKFPQQELLVAESNQTIYKPSDTVNGINQ